MHVKNIYSFVFVSEPCRTYYILSSCHYKFQPTKEQAKKALKQGEAESRRLYKYVFGDNIESKEEAGVERYQKNLEEHVFKNGGQLRDYQAEGVSWMMANYINKRGGILADGANHYFCLLFVLF